MARKDSVVYFNGDDIIEILANADKSVSIFFNDYTVIDLSKEQASELFNYLKDYLS